MKKQLPHNENYEVLANTRRYAVVMCRGLFRVENWKGLYAEDVPHVEIPRELKEFYLDLLLGHTEAPRGERREAKREGTMQFEHLCDEMFDHEHTVLIDTCKLTYTAR